jgi:hypothetical protein
MMMTRARAAMMPMSMDRICFMVLNMVSCILIGWDDAGYRIQGAYSVEAD